MGVWHSRAALSAENPYTIRYEEMLEEDGCTPMEVISHLYYRMCVKMLPVEDRLAAMRSWTGGPKARVPAQRVEYVDPAADPPLKLKHVLEVLEWLYTEMDMGGADAGIAFRSR